MTGGGEHDTAHSAQAGNTGGSRDTSPGSSGWASRLPAWAPWLILAAVLVVFAAWSLAHLGGTYWDTDEGLNLTKARMLQLGYSLYTDVWADQPPGLTAILAGAFALLGPSVQVARAVVLVHALVCLVAVAWIAREAGGGVLGATMAAVLLAVAPNFFWASRAVMIGLPALSLATLSIAMAMTYSRTRHRAWLVACGLALGLGLLEKLIGAYLVVPIALTIVLARPGEEAQGREAGGAGVGRANGALRRPRRIVTDLAIVAVSAALPAFAALLVFDAPAMIDQVVGVVVRARDAYALDLAWNTDKLGEYLLGDHLLLLAPALFGALWLLRVRTVASVVLLSWLLLTLAVLLTQAPLWPKHHFLALLVVLAPLAGLGVAAAWRAAAAWREARGVERLWLGLGLAAVAGAVIAVPSALEADAVRTAATPYKASGKLPKSEAYLRMDDAVALVQEATEPDDFVVTDHGMIAFLSGRKVPPELCVISGKRIAVGDLTAEDLVEVTQRYEPAAVLLWKGDRLTRDPLAPYAEHVRESYTLHGEIGDEYQLYVRADSSSRGGGPTTPGDTGDDGLEAAP